MGQSVVDKLKSGAKKVAGEAGTVVQQLPNGGGLTSTFIGAAKNAALGQAEYLLKGAKGQMYRGDIEKDKSVKFKEIGADEFNTLSQKAGAPAVLTFQQLQQKATSQNTPASLTSSITRAKAAENILATATGRDADVSAIDKDAALIAKKGKGVDVSANVSQARSDLLDTFKQREDELNQLAKKGKLKDGSPIPGDPNGTTVGQLRTAIDAEKAALEAPIQDATAVKAFDQQILHPPVAANPLDAPAAKAPALNPLDR